MRRAFVLILVLAGACAPPRAPGALSPVGARVTNSAVTADLVTLDSWQRRVAALGASPDTPRSAERAYAVARAGAWVAYARETYAADPRDVVADSALERARQIVSALESGAAAPDDGELAGGAGSVRGDLRLALDSLRGRVSGSERVAALADVELALVRADRLAREDAAGAPSAAAVRDAAERRCRMQAEIIRAARLVDWLRGTPAVHVAAAPQHVMPQPMAVVTREPEPPPVAVAHVDAPTPSPVGASPVVASPALTSPVVAAPAAQPAEPPRSTTQAIVAALDTPPAEAPEGGQPVRRTVHFAVGSSSLSPASRSILDGVVTIMRRHPGVGVALAGYTDWRAGTLYNRSLARRRAIAVRNYLEGTSVELGQVTIVAAGADSASRSHQNIGDYARDRRVKLVLLDANGSPLTVAGLAQAEHEHDLQVESEAQARRMAKMRWKPVPRASGGTQ